MKEIEQIQAGEFRGLAEEVPNKVYHAAPGLSKTSLDQLNKSPAHYRHWLTNGVASTPSMLFGSLCHAAVLEPKTFQDNYVAAPKGIRRGTKAWAAFTEENQGKEIIKPEDMEIVSDISKAVWSNRLAQKMLSDSRFEVSAFTDLETDTGRSIFVKCRPDVITPNGYLVDLKFVSDNSKDAFAASAARYRYDVQAAFYSDILRNLGEEVKGFVFAAVEKTAPYTTNFFVWDNESKEKGRQRYMSNLNLYLSCKFENKWEAKDVGIETISLPAWNTVED